MQTLDTPTNQEVFNSAWQRFVIDKEPRAAEGNNCVYRGDKNPESPIRCAIGNFIPNDLYNPDMERCNIDTILADKKYTEIVELFKKCDVHILKAIQRSHDTGVHYTPLGKTNNIDDHEKIKRLLVDVANTYHLTIPS